MKICLSNLLVIILIIAVGIYFIAQTEHEHKIIITENIRIGVLPDINESGMSAECLELEITEGVLMSGHAYIDDALSALNKLGIELSMDDFDTGYSSLSSLRNYPFTTLKIDRSFINDIKVDSADNGLVNATIAMAHSLGLKVIAEGVETKEQLANLKTQDCEYAQGYYFSRPVSPEKITEMLEEQSQCDKFNF